MKLLRYIVGGFIVTAVLSWIIAPGQTHGSPWLMAIAFVALFDVPPRGALWMAYGSIGYENRPLPLVLLALFVPFSFLCR